MSRSLHYEWQPSHGEVATMQDLLSMSEVTPLEVKRAQSSLCTLFKIINGLCFFPLDVLTTRPNYGQRTKKQHRLKQPLNLHAQIMPI